MFGPAGAGVGAPVAPTRPVGPPHELDCDLKRWNRAARCRCRGPGYVGIITTTRATITCRSPTRIRLVGSWAPQAPVHASTHAWLSPSNFGPDGACGFRVEVARNVPGGDAHSAQDGQAQVGEVLAHSLAGVPGLYG